jgi:hypothetical protein
MQQNISIFFEQLSVPKAVTDIKEIYSFIVDGELKSETQELRALLLSGNKTGFDRLKKKLPAVTFSGKFEGGRRSEDLKEYSQFVCLDFDKIPTKDALNKARETITQLPTTKLLFTSPSGQGVKVVAQVNSSAKDHKSVYNQVAKYYESATGLTADHTSDVTRLCFLCYDDEAFYNEDNQVFLYKPDEKSQGAEINSSIDCRAKEVFDDAVQYANKKVRFEIGNRNKFIYRLANNCNKLGLCQDFAIELCSEKYSEDGFDEQEIERIIKSAYRNTTEHNIWTRRKTVEGNVPSEASKLYDTPFFDEAVFQDIPSLIREATSLFSEKRERDIFLVSYLTIISGYMHKARGWYRTDFVYPNLFLFVSGLSAWGKNAMSKAADIFSWLKGSAKAEFPEIYSLNSSYKSIIKKLNESKGVGVLFDDEFEALSKFRKHDRDGLNHLLKQGYDNRNLPYGRSYHYPEVVAKEPKFSFLTAGNLYQIPQFIINTEDGSYSRHLFYAAKEIVEFGDIKPGEWRDFFDQRDKYAEKLSAFIEYSLGSPFEFKLTDEQSDKITQKGKALQQRFNGSSDIHMDAVIKRAGRDTFKIAMVLSCFRRYDERNSETEFTCHNSDFETALLIMDTLIWHSRFVGEILKSDNNVAVSRIDDTKTKLLAAFPVCFNRQEALAIAQGAGINLSDRSIDNYLKRMHESGELTHSHDSYCKKIA